VCPSRAATERRTSPVCLPSKWGTASITGCRSAITPGRGLESPHDSRKWRSGRTRSASADVSSGAEANDTLNPTAPKASLKRAPAGRENAGFVPWIMATPTCPPDMAAMADSTSAKAPVARAGPPWRCRVRPTFPATELRIRTARCASVALLWWAPTPGPSARLGPSSAKRRPRSRRVSSPTPVAWAAAPRSKEERREAYGPASAPEATSTAAMPSARDASEPGLMGIHSSAFWPVRDSRGPA